MEFCSFFDYGDAYVQTAAEMPNIEFVAVPHPAKVVETISDLLKNKNIIMNGDITNIIFILFKFLILFGFVCTSYLLGHIAAGTTDAQVLEESLSRYSGLPLFFI